MSGKIKKSNLDADVTAMINTLITEGSSDVSTTDDVAEGSTNLYFTDARVETAGALMDAEVANLAQVKAFDATDYATAAQGSTADAALPKAGGAMTGAITTNSTFDGRDVATDGAKLDGIEAGATGDQTAAEIRALVEAATDSNVFTDADHSKLDAIEAGATGDQTKADIEALGIDVPAANLTGTIAAARLSTATTQVESDDSTKIATTAYVTDKITTLIGGAPSTLNDLNELAAAINDDANYNTTLTTALATKLPKSGGAMTGDLSFGDNDKAIFGAGSDLQIYHDASHSWIKDVGTGNLKISAGNFEVVGAADTNAAFLYGIEGGSLYLYHNGAAKLQTTSTGVDITGTLTSDGLTVDGNVGIGETPASWSSSLNTRALQVGSVTALWEIAGQYSSLSSNHYYAQDGTQKYITSNPATRYYQQNGEHVFSGAASGTAGNNVSFSEYGRFDASGNLLVGTTSSFGSSGITLGSNSVIYAAASSQNVANFQRYTTDGEIVRFGKDGSTVGAIASGSSGNVFKWYGTFASGAGLGAYSNTSIRPLSNTGAAVDGTVTLGHSSQRFKDLHLSGTANAANFNTTSDATLKTNVETLTGSLDAVKSLRGVSFDWLENGGSEIGVIAQEVEAVLPDVVSTNDEGIKSVKYGNMVAVLIEAIKEQQAQIDELKSKLGE